MVGLFEILAEGLVITALGVSGVFIVLSSLAGIMWMMGIISSKTEKISRKRENETHVSKEGMDYNQRFSNEEFIAIISAAQAYHTLYEESEIINISRNDNAWKKFSRLEQVGERL
jgi:sodium pump decarboxylase gamma subunit